MFQSFVVFERRSPFVHDVACFCCDTEKSRLTEWNFVVNSFDFAPPILLLLRAHLQVFFFDPLEVKINLNFSKAKHRLVVALL